MEYDLRVIIFIQIIIFLGLVLLLRRIIFSASARELTRLRELSADNERKAKLLAKELERAEKEHLHKVDKAEAELRDVKANLREEAQKQKEDALRKAREEGDKIVTQALGVKDRIRTDLEGQLTERSIEMACGMMRDVLTDDKMRWFHDGLVDDIADALGGIDRARLEGVDVSKGATVQTPYPLSDAQLSALRDRLSQVVGPGLQLDQAADQSVIAGVSIRLGNLIIDGSLAGKLRRVGASAAHR